VLQCAVDGCQAAQQSRGFERCPALAARHSATPARSRLRDRLHLFFLRVFTEDAAGLQQQVASGSTFIQCLMLKAYTKILNCQGDYSNEDRWSCRAPALQVAVTKLQYARYTHSPHRS
jgi:hypothetical protein